MEFENSVVMGTGKLALACASLLREQLPTEIYDMGDIPSAFLQSGAKREGLSYRCPKPKQLFEELSEGEGRTLLVSAINPRILPACVTGRKDLTAINCHQALLPAHPGRNAEMWAIYEGDVQTGITWHKVETAVDGGDIICQKMLPITERATAFSIFREQIRMAEEGFRELLPGLLAGTAKAVPQVSEAHRLHYSWELPNGGVLDAGWDAEQISRFLRAMDYGILDVVPRPKLDLNGREYRWKKYRIIKEQRFAEGVTLQGDTICIQKPGMLIELTAAERSG